MTSSEIVALFRSEMSDVVAPYLWTDTDAFGYLDEAQVRFCRETDGLADSRTPAVTQITVIPGTDWYATHVSVLNVRRMTRADRGVKVDMMTAEQADENKIAFLPTTTGTLKTMVRGYEPHTFRATPMPDSLTRTTLVLTANSLIAATTMLFASTTGLYVGQSVSSAVAGIPANTTITALTSTTVTLSNALTVQMNLGASIDFDLTLNLQVYRLPLVTITDFGDQVLEIDSQHHSSMLLWMKHRAYAKHDTEVYDKDKSKEYENRFLEYCGKAKDEQARARRVFGNIAYGGI